MFAYLLQGASLGLYASTQPGPFQAYLLSQSMANGWRKTLPAAVAPVLSDGPIILIVLLVLTQVPDGLLSAIRIIGGLFILYLAYGAFRDYRDPPAVEERETGQRSVLKAAVMNFLNPNPWIFWSFAAGPTLAAGWQQSPTLAIMYVAAFYGIFIVMNGVLIVVFGTVGRLNLTVRRAFSLISALALLLFGLYQIIVGII